MQITTTGTSDCLLRHGAIWFWEAGTQYKEHFCCGFCMSNDRISRDHRGGEIT